MAVIKLLFTTPSKQINLAPFLLHTDVVLVL